MESLLFIGLKAGAVMVSFMGVTKAFQWFHKDKHDMDGGVTYGSSHARKGKRDDFNFFH